MGPFDDREPVYSHDGTKLAFSSDRGDPLGSDYNIWVLDLQTGALQPTDDQSGRRLHAELVARRQGDRVRVYAGWRAGLVGGDCRRRQGTQGADRRRPCRFAFVGAGRPDRLSRHSGRQSRLEVDGKSLTGDENVFAFRASWAVANRLLLRFRRQDPQALVERRRRADHRFQRDPARDAARPYTHRKRDFDSTAPRQAVGIVRPVISPDGKQVAFAAVGDIYVMPVGGKPENITKDKYLDTDPAWSPDGSQLAYSSDKGGGLLQLWIRDMRTGRSRQLTHLTTQPQGAAWSPDGKQIAFFDVDRHVARRGVLGDRCRERAGHQDSRIPPRPERRPGRRTGSASRSPRRALLEALPRGHQSGPRRCPPMGGSDKWYAPVPTLSIDSRGDCGPVWSPDGTKMAAIYEGVLAVWPVSPTGRTAGTAASRDHRERPRAELVRRFEAHSLSGAGPAEIVDIETGEMRPFRSI